MQTLRRYAPMGGSLAPVRVAVFRWNRWQTSAVYAVQLPRYHARLNIHLMVSMYSAFLHAINTMKNTIDDADYIIN